MKRKRTTKWPEKTASPLVLKETAVLPGFGLTIPVRAAKAKLSALLDLVAEGREVTITSDGVPKAVLSPARAKEERRRFMGMGEFLSSQPVHGGPSAEQLVREDRDARGW
jgi:prevent-host-death family protein